MEVIESKNGKERVIERIDFQRIRVTGKSDKNRVYNKEGKIQMFDFEGGPYYNVGGDFDFEKMKYKIVEIIRNKTSEESLVEIILKITPKY